MADKADKMQEAYFEKADTLETWSGLPVKDVYTPEDMKEIDYENRIADPGQFPFTRGIHANMYRGKYWTRREVSGFGAPEDTNARLKYQMEQGVSGLSFILDLPGQNGLDADHPRSRNEVGVQGVSISSLDDMRALLKGIPQDKVSMSFNISTPTVAVAMAQYLTVAEENGLNFEELRGTIQNDPLHIRFCGFQDAAPVDMSVKLAVDCIEYCTRHVPKFYTGNVNMYDLRELGINAPQELAFGFGIAMEFIRKTVERGLDVDEFSPRRGFYCSSHIDFFEEIAKLRAARRMWARIMTERFGAKDPRSITFKFGVHTAGCSLVPQQPLNNAIRIAYQAMAAVLAGVQSLHCCSYDEPICLPTEESQSLAIRTQQILAFETGVAKVSDPMGGSYYMENLTGQIEAEAWKILEQIESMGGMIEAIRKGWVDNEVEKAQIENQKEIDEGKKIIVGVNAFTSEPEKTTPGGVHIADHVVGRQQTEQVQKLKESRDQEAVAKAIRSLREQAVEGKVNLMPAIIEATKAKATFGEILGTIREVYDNHYDPLGIVESPFMATST